MQSFYKKKFDISKSAVFEGFHLELIVIENPEINKFNKKSI